MPNKPRRVIFTAEEVRAYMAGRKTQFRRVIDPQPVLESGMPLVAHKVLGESRWVWKPKPFVAMDIPVLDLTCPFGSPGNALYVAETWSQKAWSGADFAKMGMADRFFLDSGIEYCGFTLKIVYRADGDSKYFEPWKPSTNMPRYASRLGPVVTEVRVQQLWDITVDDVYAEGLVPQETDFEALNCGVRFQSVWDSRNTKPAHTWDANPWVWAVTVTPYEKGNDND